MSPVKEAAKRPRKEEVTGNATMPTASTPPAAKMPKIEKEDGTNPPAAKMPRTEQMGVVTNPSADAGHPVPSRCGIHQESSRSQSSIYRR